MGLIDTTQKLYPQKHPSAFYASLEMRFSNHINVSSVLISILDYLSHDLQGPCRLVITYKQVNQGHLEKAQAQNQFILYLV